ncbi:MAG: DUF2185 domain-containing protein [Sphingobacteriales bacterium]|nr:MAG: DUF2185 domain-containing protein [Sphingobacteriales bacterium]
MEKNFKIKSENIKRLVGAFGGCMASDKITVDGLPVLYMYREEQDFQDDSGWRFFSGIEDQDYTDNAENWSIYDVNTIANYDRGIIPYLELPVGTELDRFDEDSEFQIVAAS